MQLNRVGRDSRLAMEEVKEGDPGDARSPAETGAAAPEPSDGGVLESHETYTRATATPR
jgi:hypothetical protein